MSPTAPPHPLAPLTADEIRTAVAIARRRPEITPNVRFVLISLREPDKRLPHDAGRPVPREVSMVLRDRKERRTYEAVVSLTRAEVIRWEHVPGARTPITEEDFVQCGEAVRADPRWRRAMRRRGVTDFSLAMIDAWPAEAVDAPGEPDRRLAHPLTFVRAYPGDNGYARPVENLVVLVDLDSLEVLEVTDDEAVPLPPMAGNYDPEVRGGEAGLSSPVRDTGPPDHPPLPDVRPAADWPPDVRTRQDLRPIDITQPEGPSFTVDGYAVRWQKWRFRIGFTVREGLVLHQVAYEDGGRPRPVLHRAALSEIYTPYGDPGLTHRRKNAFDQGEYGAGFLLNSLEPGCDCLGDIHYFDVTSHDQDGNPVVQKNAVCMHEEDTGIIWKHTDFRTGKAVTRRGRRLVVSTFAVLGNYQYGYFWYFSVDGTIRFEVKLTGMISTGAFSGARPRSGTAVAPGLYGPHHQHFFNMRLDVSVDGDRNSVYEVDSVPLPAGDRNPHGNGWRTEATLLDSEKNAARRVAHAPTGRFWRVVNPRARNGLGEPTGYRLVPESGLLPIEPEGGKAWHRARFVYGHLWVTAYDPRQTYAAGDYPWQRRADTGLPAYTAADRPLADTDVVLWHTFGEHHVVRPEDWPAMPVVTTGFSLRPDGFFDGNPALDLPAPTGHCTVVSDPDGDEAGMPGEHRGRSGSGEPDDPKETT
ncbi:primary-amine oxidase [Streptomyces sp. NPDC003077]|uniref:primary-amine oxidase n=1 Tax=Streptomyces sp. NPDC003077 TaxID=3154443 RepID=UPI0033A8B969